MASGTARKGRVDCPELCPGVPRAAGHESQPRPQGSRPEVAQACRQLWALGRSGSTETAFPPATGWLEPSRDPPVDGCPWPAGHAPASPSPHCHSWCFSGSPCEGVVIFFVLQVSVALGCASCGRTVAFASTFAAFLTRAFDQMRMGAISRISINLIGSHCGVSIGMRPQRPSPDSLFPLQRDWHASRGPASVPGGSIMFDCL